MRFVLFYHSLISDWNHGNAHFLRGIVRELLARGHEVRVYEPEDAWSAQNLIADAGAAALDSYRDAYPELTSIRYNSSTLNLAEVLSGADVVLVHEWNSHELVADIGRWHEANLRYGTGSPVLLFHDTHHRAVTDPGAMAAYDLRHYDGVLAFGDVIRRVYLEQGWSKQAWIWHEAADTTVFYPRGTPQTPIDGDLVWIGNWGDGERSAELHEYLLGPVKQLGLTATVYGVRYPQHALEALADAGVEYKGWLPNYKAPEIFARHKMTVHVPRRPYVEALPGIPTIRVFEALACGIPLISAPWNDGERLFNVGQDFVMVNSGNEMVRAMQTILSDPACGATLSSRGVRTICERHTCVKRVDELMTILDEVRHCISADGELQ